MLLFDFLFAFKSVLLLLGSHHNNQQTHFLENRRNKNMKDYLTTNRYRGS